MDVQKLQHFYGAKTDCSDTVDIDISSSVEIQLDRGRRAHFCARWKSRQPRQPNCGPAIRSSIGFGVFSSVQKSRRSGHSDSYFAFVLSVYDVYLVSIYSSWQGL
ncbi:hypothetical protein MAP00_003167 [Monascus purpureus]|nr:hypothetical protein MAP00_003167 [Monascus purpureus]